MWVRAALLFLLSTDAFAQAEKRTALLIGNKDYKVGLVRSPTRPTISVSLAMLSKLSVSRF